MDIKKTNQLRGRGIKLRYYITPHIAQKDRAGWKYTLLQQSGVADYFETCDVTFYEVDKNIMEIKIFCPEAKFMIAPKDVKKMYFDGFKPITEWIENTFHKNKSGISYKITNQSYEVVYRIGSDESDLVPLKYFEINRS